MAVYQACTLKVWVRLLVVALWFSVFGSIQKPDEFEEVAQLVEQQTNVLTLLVLHWNVVRTTLTCRSWVRSPSSSFLFPGTLIGKRRYC